MGMPGGRTAVQNAMNPLVWNGLTAIHGTQKNPTDGGVSVGVPATHDGVHHYFF
jgi:hypothetical protein